MIILFFYIIFFNSFENIEKFEKKLEKLRKINNLYDLKINLDSYNLKFEIIKRENKIDELKKLKYEIDYDLNEKLKAKYKEILENIEKNKDYFGENINAIEYHKNYFKEIELRIEEKENLENFNEEIIQKINEIHKSFKDPCPDYFQNAENSNKINIKIENLCNILKNPCLFSEDLKGYAEKKIEEEKNNLFFKIKNKNDLKDLDLIYISLNKCYENDPEFLEDISSIKDNLLEEIKGKENISQEDLYILKMLGQEEKIKNLPQFKNKVPEKIQEKEEKEIIVKKELRKEEPFELEKPYLIIDIWQSAWGDFKELDILLNYIKKNKISEVNLNIGKEITEKKETKDKAKAILKRIVSELYKIEVKKVNLLYAELNYPIERYAQFLQENKDLGIDKIVDDSEFTDKSLQNYSGNSFSTKKYDIKYSVFVTVEKEGNSGVSDPTRYYLLKEADEVILMSYFSCDLEGQKKWIEKYLSYADDIKKENSVKIAILMGSKSVGREKSCEYLGKENIYKFLSDLHRWAASNFSSYSGIVLETNKKLPPDLY